MPTSLKDLRVLVTRPEGQAQTIIETLKQQGANVWHFPLVKISPIISLPASNLQDHLSRYDLLIFISPTAVRCFADTLGDSSALPARLTVACIGSGSAREFSRIFSRTPDIFPPEAAIQDSEALLACPQLTQSSIKNKHILIIRGKGGREKLATVLQQRQAKIDYLEVYQRLTPTADVSPLLQSIAEQQLDVIIIYSSEALHNLMQLVTEPYTQQLLAIPLVTIHPRQSQVAKGYGFSHIYPAQGAAVENIMTTLKTIN